MARLGGVGGFLSYPSFKGVFEMPVQLRYFRFAPNFDARRDPPIFTSTDLSPTDDLSLTLRILVGSLRRIVNVPRPRTCVRRHVVAIYFRVNAENGSWSRRCGFHREAGISLGGIFSERVSHKY